MKLLRVAAWTVGFMLSWVALAHAAPVVGIISALGSLFGSLGIIGKLLLGIALNLGMGLLQKALHKKPEQREPALQAEIQVGGDNPLSSVMGRSATAGQLEYVNFWGEVDKTPNAYLTHVISISDLPLALTGLWVNDEKVTLPNMTGSPPTAQGWPVAQYALDGQYYLWIKYHDGTQTAADSFLTSVFGGDADRPWKSDQIGRGVAYVVLTARRNNKLFNGPPSYLFETSGTKLYDVRKDSTAGGSGSQRWNDPSTWAVSNNPVVQIYNIIRGVRYGSEWVYGGQTFEAYQLPAANWMAAANVCDQDVDLKTGGVQKRYQSGFQFTTDQPPADTIESILKGCSGRLAEVGGSFKITVGSPGAAIYSFTDEQIIVTEGQSYDPFPGLENTFNGAQASYPEPAEKWASKDAPAYLRSDLEALDDDRRLVTGLTFPTVPYAVQVQRLLKEAVQDARRFRQHSFYLPPEALLLEPGDVVSWSSDRNSYTNKKFLVVEAADQPNLLMLVTLKEVDPNDYSWDPETDEHEYSVGFIGPVRPPVQLMTGWQVFPAALTDAEGNNRRPTIGVRFDGDLDDVRDVRVQVRLDEGDVLQFDGTIPYGDPDTNDNPKEILLNGTFLPDTDYEARGVYVPISGRPVSWSAWLPVKTDDIRFGDKDVYLPGMVKEINDRTDLVLKPLQVSVRDRIEEARQIAASAIEQDAGQYRNKQQSLTQVRSVFETVTADYQLLVTAMTGPDSVIVQRLETIEVDLSGKASVQALNSIGLVATDVDGEITGVGTAISGIIAQVNDSLASGMFRTYVEATETGALATIGISAAASSDGATSQAAILVSALSNGKSMIGLVADQVYMTDGAGNKKYPFVFSGGVARLQNVVVGTLKFDQLSSNNDKLRLRGSGSFADISVFV